MIGRNSLIAPLTNEQFERSKTNGPPVMKRAASVSADMVVTFFPPRDEVQSRHRLQIDVSAENQDEATRLAGQIADRLLVSLSLSVPNARYFAEMKMIRKVGEKREHTAWSQTLLFIPLAPAAELLTEDTSNVSRMMETLQNDEIAENAYENILAAWKLQQTPGSKPLERSILQHYVLSFESVVNGIMARIRSECRDKIRLEERMFANGFVEAFYKRADKPAALREAAGKLREISLSNTLPAIKLAAERLGLPDDVVAKATELYKFRSRNLSHPGRAAREDLHTWLKTDRDNFHICEADNVARKFLTAYCDHVASS